MNDQVSEAEAVGWRDRFGWRRRYILLSALVVLALLFYAILPTLLGHAAAAMAGRIGLATLDV